MVQHPDAEIDTHLGRLREAIDKMDQQACSEAAFTLFAIVVKDLRRIANAVEKK